MVGQSCVPLKNLGVNRILTISFENSDPKLSCTKWLVLVIGIQVLSLHASPCLPPYAYY